MEKLNINQWAKEDRPREKMADLGTEALSNAELLAILIGSGSTDESAVDLMKKVLNDCNNSLNTLGKKSIHDLCEYKGIGEARPSPSSPPANSASVVRQRPLKSVLTWARPPKSTGTCTTWCKTSMWKSSGCY